MATKTTQSIAFDPEVLEGIKDLAAEDRRSVSAYINLVLADHLLGKQAASQPKAGKPRGKQG